MALRKELRHLLNSYGSIEVERELSKLIANPTEKYRSLWGNPSIENIIARDLDHAANIVSGLHLEYIEEDGHSVANLLWKISAHIRKVGT
jgi:hypothetical protein